MAVAVEFGGVCSWEGFRAASTLPHRAVCRMLVLSDRSRPPPTGGVPNRWVEGGRELGIEGMMSPFHRVMN